MKSDPCYQELKNHNQGKLRPSRPVTHLDASLQPLRRFTNLQKSNCAAGEVVVPTIQTSEVGGLQGNGNSRLLGVTGCRRQLILKVNPLETSRNPKTLSPQTKSRNVATIKRTDSTETVAWVRSRNPLA